MWTSVNSLQVNTAAYSWVSVRIHKIYSNEIRQLLLQTQGSYLDSEAGDRSAYSYCTLWTPEAVWADGRKQVLVLRGKGNGHLSGHFFSSVVQR